MSTPAPVSSSSSSRSSVTGKSGLRRSICPRGLDRLDSEILSQVFGQGRPRVSAALSSLRSSEAEPLLSDNAGLRRSLARSLFERGGGLQGGMAATRCRRSPIEHRDGILLVHDEFPQGPGK